MARRKSICGRDPNAGPGTCHFWWDSCPAKIGDCFQRHMRSYDVDHGITAEHYGAMTEEQFAQHIAEAVAAWPSKRLAGKGLFDV